MRGFLILLISAWFHFMSDISKRFASSDFDYDNIFDMFISFWFSDPVLLILGRSFENDSVLMCLFCTVFRAPNRGLADGSITFENQF